jgi:hypothetical protein
MTLRRTPANRFLSTFSRILLIPNGSRSGAGMGSQRPRNIARILGKFPKVSTDSLLEPD